VLQSFIDFCQVARVLTKFVASQEVVLYIRDKDKIKVPMEEDKL